MVVVQLADQLLLIPEGRSSNLIIGKLLCRTSLQLTDKKTKIKKKRPGMAH